jgi:carboxylesterase type B
MGQSAGASSILHHITAAGGDHYRPPIRQAILESPGFFPQPDNALENSKYQKFLALTESKDIEAVLALPKDSLELINANANMTYNSSYGLFEFGPTIDGWYVKELPGVALKNGNFHKGFPLFLGYTRNDGVAFTPPWIRSDDELGGYVRQLFPNVTKSVLDYVNTNYAINPDIEEREKIRQVANFLDVSTLLFPSNAPTNPFIGHCYPVQHSLPHSGYPQVSIEFVSPSLPICL